MRHIRQQLISLLKKEGMILGTGRARLRLSIRLLHSSWQLLDPSQPPISLHIRPFSCGSFHRHLLLIRCPDQAFYYDAVRNYLHRKDISLLEQQTITLNLQRNAGEAPLLRNAQPDDGNNLMLIALHLSATLVNDVAQLSRDLNAILQAVALSVRDFDAMRHQLAEVSQALLGCEPEQATLLEWMLDEKYIFYGIAAPQQPLGVISDNTLMEQLAPNLQSQLKAAGDHRPPGIYWLQLPATHRYLYSASLLEVIELVWDTPQGRQQAMMLGHFSRSARHFSASRTPLIKLRWQQLLQHPLLCQSSFYRRELRSLFDSVPKHMLLSIEAEQWLDPLKEIVDLADSRQITVNHLHPQLGTADYLMVTLSTARFGPNVTANMHQALLALGINVQGINSFGVASYRILLFACDNQQPQTWPNANTIKQALAQCVIFWRDRARDALMALGEQIALPDALAMLKQVSSRYHESFSAEQYAEDYLLYQQMQHDGTCRIRVHHAGERLLIQILSPTQLALGSLVERVQAFGLIAIDETVATLGDDNKPMYISQLGCKYTAENPISQDAITRLQEALTRVINHERDHDLLNALLLSAGLDIDQVAVMITLRNYLVQLEREAAISPLTQTMIQHPKVTRALFRLFEARHRPAMPITYAAQAQLEFDQTMVDVSSLSHDRWLRALQLLINASLRSNQWSRTLHDPVVIKIDGQAIGFGPTPRPWREVFVHGTHVEGVHLRAGAVARGGLRYSDRPADFRTEVHELMLTQTVKNGQIVPTGAKGGFVIRGGKGEPFVRQQYRVFVNALLSVTDNLLAGEVVPPSGMVVPSADADDTYLVVAADKGTARYSDEANDLSRDHHFWLDDAFASGGCHGYDHKKVGITARGAWACAVHHFRCVGIDAYHDPISVVGIGDMGGDVFGNGMLLNPAMKVVAAFNHRHIFIDPEPQAEPSFNERKRLFKAVAGWDQYDTGLISEGGGIFLRSAKSITISDAMRRLFRIDNNTLSGEELIQTLLAAKVDMLYNGGIGTYIKAEKESHAQARDPANNAVRINAEQVQAKVICEGGNLGITQLARIVMASRGIRLNTDAIDNAAGVNMSDHEVNLKILLTLRWPGADGIKSRNQMTARQTEAVTRICIDDNIDQTQALTLAEIEAKEYPPRLLHLRDLLAGETMLDRTLQDDAVLMLRPQLSMLLGYEKNRLHEALNQAHFSDNSCFSDHLLANSFPAPLARRFKDQLHTHPLAADMVHTQAANHLINQFGICCVSHLQSMVDASITDIVQALLVADALLDGKQVRAKVWQQVETLDEALSLLRAMQEQILLLAEELLRIHPVMEIDAAWLRRSRRGICHLFASLDRSRVEMFSSGKLWNHHRLLALGIDDDLAWQITAWPLLARSAVAVHLAGDGCALSRLLAANHAALTLLPLLQLEAPLRTTSWAISAAHQLRREWLQRLSAMRCHAVLILLRESRQDFEAVGQRLWHHHPAWSKIALQSDDGESDEKLQLLLSLSRLQSVVEQS
ncbi:MAG: NAD-glutamate dehydrogenase [Mariprofundales bacterium]